MVLACNRSRSCPAASLSAVSTVLGGSGFLAVYLFGVIVGNRSPRESQHFLQGHNGLAWLAQIGMFLQYGLPLLPEAQSGQTLAQFLSRSLHGRPVVGHRVRLGKLEFVVHAVTGSHLVKVGLRIPTYPDIVS